MSVPFFVRQVKFLGVKGGNEGLGKYKGKKNESVLHAAIFLLYVKNCSEKAPFLSLFSKINSRGPRPPGPLAEVGEKRVSRREGRVNDYLTLVPIYL